MLHGVQLWLAFLGELDAPVQLEEVFVFKGGADGFPELVLCYGIHTVIGYDLGVVAVDYFVKNEGVG
ncbi:hypothetical protein FRC0293_02229 [Corynebacterium diphtheriae]|nr:hypothetical protein FRC0132_00011 [Corynebacterium diphtheriae]CAB0764167.1 hypothetical protein FRC0135_02263 [Corynebacterium diphtheriae]CAB0829005.1 hypothetical protein FRC0293_02229 [Corynebacterium diphtheriae]CAB0864680.1 hypothetical protein FRC0294_02228 [Corynebacterium diphtheriae]